MKRTKQILGSIKLVFLSLLLLLFLTPFALILINSLKSRMEIVSNPLSLPAKLDFSNYVTAFNKMAYMHGLVNSLIITVFSVCLITICASMTAYIFVRRKWKFNQYMFFIMIASMIIPFQGIMIPLVKIYGSIGMLNSKWALIYMYVGFGVALAVFMLHGFIKSIPLELEEAAEIDGCTQLQTFFKIVFPLLKPITMTIIILDVLWIWNDFLLPSLVLIAPVERTLPLSTFYFNQGYTVEFGYLMAALVLSMIPVLALYLFIQKHIIEGVLQGSIK